MLLCLGHLRPSVLALLSMLPPVSKLPAFCIRLPDAAVWDFAVEGFLFHPLFAKHSVFRGALIPVFWEAVLLPPMVTVRPGLRASVGNACFERSYFVNLAVTTSIAHIPRANMESQNLELSGAVA